MAPKAKNLPGSAGDTVGVARIPGSGRSPGGGNGSPLPHPCLESAADRGAWWAAVHGLERARHGRRAHTLAL